MTSTGPHKPDLPSPLDQTTWEQLYARLERPLYNVVYRWLWQAEDAQDVVQEAFMRLWDMRQRVDSHTAQALVYRIALNLAANRRRRRKVWRWVTLEALRQTADEGPGAEALVSAHQQKAAVRRAIDALPEKQRRVMTLCAFGAMSYAEIADILEISPGTVASRRHTALQNLQHMLAKEGKS